MQSKPTPGTVAVLNTIEGDAKFSFDPSNPVEAARAERVVMDMLRRGYILFAEIDGKLERVVSFDPQTAEYIIADGPGDIVPPPRPITTNPETSNAPRNEAVKAGPQTCQAAEPAATPKRRGRPPGSGKGKRVKAGKVAVTGVAPTAGG